MLEWPYPGTSETINRGNACGADMWRAAAMAAFTVSEDGTHIIGRFTENLTEATAFTLLDELLTLSTATKLSKVLIDARRITVPLNTTAIYRLGLALAARLSPEYKLAVVMSSQAGNNTIFRAVVAGHGPTMRYFSKPSVARAWLLQM
jgi:hypothetical protein